LYNVANQWIPAFAGMNAGINFFMPIPIEKLCIEYQKRKTHFSPPKNHHSITPILHHSSTPVLQYSITPILSY
jgi:hypothetical protein